MSYSKETSFIIAYLKSDKPALISTYNTCIHGRTLTSSAKATRQMFEEFTTVLDTPLYIKLLVSATLKRVDWDKVVTSISKEIKGENHVSNNLN